MKRFGLPIQADPSHSSWHQANRCIATPICTTVRWYESEHRDNRSRFTGIAGSFMVDTDRRNANAGGTIDATRATWSRPVVEHIS